jgi:phosphoribosyl-ATP pyrophosphohydrolase
MRTIDYNLLSLSVDYYEKNGFMYIDVPWWVPEEYINITYKPETIQFKFDNKRCLVGSAEQSFLNLHFTNKLKPGSYQAITPCFRDDNEDNTHQKYFLKNELFISEEVSYKKLYDTVDKCVNFFNLISSEKVKIHQTNIDNIDIYLNEIEIGSYGIRTYKDFSWIYATGIALPRFSIANKTNVYHKNIIQKGEYGHFSKIIEEFQELIDANKQKDKILEIIELSDLIGSIEGYIEKKYNNLTLEDLIKFSYKTKESFKTGKRK